MYSAVNGGGSMVKDWTTIAGPGLGAASYSADWAVDWASAIEGVNYVSVRAVDLIGNVTYSTDVFYLKKDVTPPNIAAINILGYDGPGKTYSLTNDSGAWWNFETPYFEWANISDLPVAPASSGVKQYLVYFGNNVSAAPTTTFATAATIAVTTTEPVSPASDTSYYLIVAAEDIAGNVSTRSIYYYNYDEDAPSPPTNVRIWDTSAKAL
jgi:hypothetical protein